MTSPIPARPANVSGLAPAAIPSRVISARPRVISPALPLSPKPSPSAAPAAIATMFFSAPHSSTPSRSLVHVEPELAAAEPRRRSGRRARVLGGDDRRRGQAAGDLERRGSGRTARRPAARTMPPGVGDHLAHPQQRPGLEALDHRQDVRGRARSTRRDPLDRSTGDGADGHGEDRRGRRVGEGGRIRGDGDRRRQLDRRAGAARVLAGGVDPRGGLRVVGEQDDRLRPGDQDGEGRAPGAGPTTATRGRGAHRPSASTASSRRVAPWPFARGRPSPARASARAARAAAAAATDSRSRKTSRIGVPSKPNASRSRFSR